MELNKSYFLMCQKNILFKIITKMYLKKIHTQFSLATRNVPKNKNAE